MKRLQLNGLLPSFIQYIGTEITGFLPIDKMVTSRYMDVIKISKKGEIINQEFSSKKIEYTTVYRSCKRSYRNIVTHSIELIDNKLIIQNRCNSQNTLIFETVDIAKSYYETLVKNWTNNNRTLATNSFNKMF